ncbi:hypothetical protein C8J57DRAFT_1481603 [Mycena rebaudengoi]|nr:hypothetical protein C8J57DRAFT_1481603 [Mycena rebaudengoi]
MKNILSVIFALAVGAASTPNIEPAGAAIRSTKTCGDPTLAVPYYWMYASSVGRHFYSRDVAIVSDTLRNSAWALEGVAAFVFATQEASTIPFYRLANTGTGDNMFTSNTTEIAVQKQNGYTLQPQETQVYVYPTQIYGSVPFYQLSHLALNYHFYTASQTQRIEYIRLWGYTDQGIAGYVLAPELTECT